MAETSTNAKTDNEPGDREDMVYTPGPPNAERVGLWRTLTISLVLAVVALVLVYVFVV